MVAQSDFARVFVSIVLALFVRSVVYHGFLQDLPRDKPLVLHREVPAAGRTSESPLHREAGFGDGGLQGGESLWFGGIWELGIFGEDLLCEWQ